MWTAWCAKLKNKLQLLGKQNFDEFLRIRKFEIWITQPGIHEKKKKNIPENVSKLTSL